MKTREKVGHMKNLENKNYRSIKSLNKNSGDLKILIKNYGSINSLNKNLGNLKLLIKNSGSKKASTRTRTI